MRNQLIPWAITLTIFSIITSGCAGSLDFEHAGEKLHVQINLHAPPTDNTSEAIVPNAEEL